MRSFIELIVFAGLMLGCSHSHQPVTGSADVLSRMPSPVATAFQADHTGTTVKRVHIRLFPDGTEHYQITYVDSSGELGQAEYYGNGRPVRAIRGESSGL